ncbi:MAG TPA: O-succinylhomoserine sulfhydrylase [Dongiaceae bacterium]|jgi:O-succinylhomoserine sulfhydrylase|nr:O-succinylhomoserine sulfhydrylase [Dongiaceae bacterium]
MAKDRAMTSDSDTRVATDAAGQSGQASPASSAPAVGRSDPEWRLATKLVQGGVLRSPFGETCEAIYMTSGYVYGSAEEAEAAFANTKPRFIYSRFSNPTVQMFEDRMALLEGAQAARATATGMAAVFAALACLLRAGDRVVASDALFGSCQYILAEILPRFGVETVFVDGRDLGQWKKALSRKTQAVFIETPSNPGLRLVDLPAVAKFAHAAGAKLVVDNVFATPLLQRPLEFGADVVVYSATKHIDGQGRSLGGVILGSKAYVEEQLQPFLRHTGPALSPMNAWLLLKGLETLELRVARHCANAARIADFLARQKKVIQLLYPGLASHPQHDLARAQMTAGGSLVTFELAGGKPAAFRFLNALKLAVISNNLGDTKSLATHPATTTHQRLTPEARAQQGITAGMVRLSVGLEDPVDIEADLAQALAA